MGLVAQLVQFSDGHVQFLPHPLDLPPQTEPELEEENDHAGHDDADGSNGAGDDLLHRVVVVRARTGDDLGGRRRGGGDGREAGLALKTENKMSPK